MMKFLPCLLLCAVFSVGQNPPTERLVGLFSPRHDGPPTSLIELNPMTGEPIGTPKELRIVSSTLKLDRGTGMTYDPITRRMFVVADTIPELQGRALLGVNPDTGECTFIGDTGEIIAGLTTDGFGQLWGVTGKDGNNTHSLWKIDVPTARPIFQAPLPQGQNGEAIAFNARDGLLYRVTRGLPAENGESICALSPASPRTMRLDKLPLRFGSPVTNLDRQPMSMIFSPSGDIILVSADVGNQDFEMHTIRFPSFQPLNTVKLRDRYKGLAFLPPEMN